MINGAPLGAGVAAKGRRAAAAALLASLTGPPLLLLVLVGRPDAGELAWWQWAAGLEYQSLPVEPLLAVIGLLAWVLWAYAALVTVMRVVAVVATRRGVSGVGRLLAFSDLVTVAPIRSLVDATVGVSLLASATHVVSIGPTVTGPPAVVRTIETRADWDRPPDRLGAVYADPEFGGPDQQVPSPQTVAAGPAAAVAATCPAEGSNGRLYTVVEGDTLWRIAERELGDGHRWPEIFAANQSRRMGDGQRLHHAGLILPGWQLLLPSPSAPPGAPSADPLPIDPAPRVRPAPRLPVPPATSEPSVTAPDRPGPSTPAPAPDDGPHAAGRDIVELRGLAFGLLAAVQSFGNLAASAIAGLLWTLASLLAELLDRCGLTGRVRRAIVGASAS